jgi:hypothetical protein
MPRNKGIGMRKPKKKKVPAIEKLPEVNSSPDDLLELNLVNTSRSFPNNPALPAPVVSQHSQEQYELVYARAYERSQLSKALGKKYASKWLLARRLFKAKMDRFAASVDRCTPSPLGQIERYHSAKYELATAALNHECFLNPFPDSLYTCITARGALH